MFRLFSRARRSRGPVVLLVWDGFGVSTETMGNPVIQSRMPHFDRLRKMYAYTLLDADGEAVGLPSGVPGNSEAGHATLGAGRVVPTDIVRIDHAISDGSFFENAALLRARDHVRTHRSMFHLVGLLTDGRSGHASPDHVDALLRFVRQSRLPHVALHLITDGRDTAPYQALELLSSLERRLPKGCIIGSLIGRFYAMDRNRQWTRTELAYNLLVKGEGIVADNPLQGISQAYARGESDEYILPTVICDRGTCVAPIRDGDAVVFWNLRSDRARQLIKPFAEAHFEVREKGSFTRSVVRRDIALVTLTEFGADLDHVLPAFPHRQIPNTLVETLRFHKQLYAAESEKFSQVTYFFNGGSDRARFGEDRIRVPSPSVARYNEAPRMSADRLTKKVLSSMRTPYDFVLVNYANADMVAHTGDMSAAVIACETLDACLGRMWKTVSAKRGTLLVTADHGNIETMVAEHGGPDTEHNAHPVPFLAAGSSMRGAKLRQGTLADVAPTVLRLLGVKKPREMTGTSLY